MTEVENEKKENQFKYAVNRNPSNSQQKTF